MSFVKRAFVSYCIFYILWIVIIGVCICAAALYNWMFANTSFMQTLIYWNLFIVLLPIPLALVFLIADICLVGADERKK